MALYHASLKIFEKAGFMEALRTKSEALTGYLIFVVNEVNKALGEEQFKVITPTESADRGAQVSIIAKDKGKEIFQQLVAHNVLGDWREPNVIRMSPVPLYNSFEDVFKTGALMLKISKEIFV